MRYRVFGLCAGLLLSSLLQAQPGMFVGWQAEADAVGRVAEQAHPDARFRHAAPEGLGAFFRPPLEQRRAAAGDAVACQQLLQAGAFAAQALSSLGRILTRAGPTPHRRHAPSTVWTPA
mgnify:CR=1 FL=1